MGSELGKQFNRTRTVIVSCPAIRSRLFSVLVVLTGDVPAGDVPASEVDGTPPPSTSAAAGKALLRTAVSQPTVNPTWAVSEISWLLADVRAEDLEHTRCESSTGIDPAINRQILNRQN